MTYEFSDHKEMSFVCPKCYAITEFFLEAKLHGDEENGVSPRTARLAQAPVVCYCGRCGSVMFETQKEISHLVRDLMKYGCDITSTRVASNKDLPRVFPVVRVSIDDSGVTTHTSISIDEIADTPDMRIQRRTPNISISGKTKLHIRKKFMDAAEKVIKDYEWFRLFCHKSDKEAGGVVECSIEEEYCWFGIRMKSIPAGQDIEIPPVHELNIMFKQLLVYILVELRKDNSEKE